MHHLNPRPVTDRKSTRLNSSHVKISYAVFCLKKKTRNGRKAASPPWGKPVARRFDLATKRMGGFARSGLVQRHPPGECEGLSCNFFFNDTATTEIYTLSLHDALPI